MECFKIKDITKTMHGTNKSNAENWEFMITGKSWNDCDKLVRILKWLSRRWVK